MTPFFRRIRLKLANENQFLRYSRYAIGEIILVVVGILIALQINNWNETRIEKIQEHHILEIILEDLYLADNKSKELVEKEVAIFNNLENFLGGPGQRNELVNHPKVDSIFGNLIWGSVGLEVPVINAYQDLKNAGKTNLISSETIRSHFTTLENRFARLKKSLQDRLNVQEKNIDNYILKNMNFIPLLKTSDREFKVDYGEPNNYTELFKDRFIINSIASKFDITTSILDERTLLQKEIDELIKLIEGELNSE